MYQVQVYSVYSLILYIYIYITQLKIDALLCVNGKGYNHYKNNLLITFPTTYPRGFVAKTTAVQ